MINAKIVNARLGMGLRGDEVILAVLLVAETKDKNYVIGPITIESLNDLAKILTIAGTSDWESVIGSLIQIEAEGDFVTKMANCLDDEIFTSFSKIEDEIANLKIKDTNLE